MSFPPPRITDLEVLTALRALFDAVEYREESVSRILGLGSLLEISRIGAGVLEWRTRGGTAIEQLTRLFLLELKLPAAQAEATLGSGGMATLLAAGLLARTSQNVEATVRLRPVGALRIASDRLDQHKTESPDFVIGAGPMPLMLAGAAIPIFAGRTLDLGCGAGVIACLLASRSKAVVATDINPRALAFATFNAALNGIEQVEVRAGDLYSPVAGERFDLILSNPPMVISPESTFLYRDGGSDFCARVVREAPAHLSETGCLEMFCNWPERTGADWRETPSSWFEGTGCDAWLLRLHRHDAVAYADHWLRQQYHGAEPPAGELARWSAHLQTLGIEGIGGGLLVMRRVQGRAPWVELREAPPIGDLAGASIARILAARDLLARIADDAELLAARLAPAPELEAREVRRPSGDGWQQVRSRLQLARGLGFGLAADPALTGIVAHLNGQRTLAQAAQAFADSQQLPVASFLPGLPAVARKLLELGMLMPAGD